MNPFFEPRHAQLAKEAAGFARGVLRPLPPAEDDESARRQARQILGVLGESGFCRHAVPAAWGGAAPDVEVRSLCLIREALASESPLADAVFALQCLGSTPIALVGGDSLRQRWLPEVAAGRAMAAFAMTEAEAGSDVAAIATRAARDGEDYVLDGRKTLISNAGLADFYTVFASTDPERGKRGLSCFVVPADAPGLRFLGPQKMSAPHPLGEIALESCRVPASARLGEEGEGFELGMRTLDRLRPTVAAAACGMAARALSEALDHARKRRQFGKPLGEFQLIQVKLAAMATDLEAALLLVHRAAWTADLGVRPVTMPAAMAKAFATEAAQRTIDQAIQIVGGQGVLAHHPLDRLYRAVRALRIYEGTTEIQQLIIARELLRSGE